MSRQTSKPVASNAARVLADPTSSAAQRSAAASALTQHRSFVEETSARAASIASRVMRDPRATTEQRSAAASTLSQRSKR